MADGFSTWICGHFLVLTAKKLSPWALKYQWKLPGHAATEAECVWHCTLESQTDGALLIFFPLFPLDSNHPQLFFSFYYFLFWRKNVWAAVLQCYQQTNTVFKGLLSLLTHFFVGAVPVTEAICFKLPPGFVFSLPCYWYTSHLLEDALLLPLSQLSQFKEQKQSHMCWPAYTEDLCCLKCLLAEFCAETLMQLGAVLLSQCGSTQV